MHTILCAISQSTYFAVSYNGSLDRMLHRIILGKACAKYSRKAAVISTLIAWAMVLMNETFTLYSVFFTDGHMDYMLTPITTHVNLSDLLLPRILLSLCRLYLTAAWIFPHAMIFMLAIVFTHQYKMLSRSLDTMLAENTQRGLSDADIETLRQHHEEISLSVNDTDDFLMFHNAGAFCFQLVKSIVLLYDLMFFAAPNDRLIIGMRHFWMFGVFFGLTVTTAAGIMVNHYVSTQSVVCLCVYCSLTN